MTKPFEHGDITYLAEARERLSELTTPFAVIPPLAPPGQDWWEDEEEAEEVTSLQALRDEVIGKVHHD